MERVPSMEKTHGDPNVLLIKEFKTKLDQFILKLNTFTRVANPDPVNRLFLGYPDPDPQSTKRPCKYIF